MHPINILVVDHHIDRLAELAELLTICEYHPQTTAVSDANFSLDLQSPSADLILIHISLASKYDFQLLRQAQNRQILQQVPMVIYGAKDDLISIDRAMELGAADYLTLPTTPVLLKTRIRASLEKRLFREQAAWYLREFNEMEKLADDLRLKILPLGIALSAEKDFDHLLERILIEAMEICNADAGTLYLRTEDDHLRYVIDRTNSLGLHYGGGTGTAVPFPPIPLYQSDGAPNHSNAATYAALAQESVNVADVYHVNGFDFSSLKAFDQQNRYRSVSCLTVPLLNGEAIGVLQLLNAQDEEMKIVPFQPYHQLVAESLASQATVVLHNHILVKRHEELMGYQRELEIARRLQAGFLPTSLPQISGWELAARLKPARTVSGDFYDLFLLPDGCLGLIVADVCDKGVVAALFMALLRSLLRAFMQQSYILQEQLVAVAVRPFTDISLSLTNAITLTNNYIIQQHAPNNMFATLFFGVLNPHTGLLTYVNAGHNPPLLISHDGSISPIEPTAPAVGLYNGARFRVGDLILQTGDTLFAYTDGITDARDPEKQFFSSDRLNDLLSNPVKSVTALLDEVETAVHQHIDGAGQFDDITLLALKRLNAGGDNPAG